MASLGENESLLPTSGLLKRLQGPALPMLDGNEGVRDQSSIYPFPRGMPARIETQTGAESQPELRDLAYSLNSLSAGADTQAGHRQELLQSKSASGGVPSSAEIRHNLIDRRWVPQMSGQEDLSSANHSMEAQQEGDLSLSGVIHAPHSTLRSPQRNLALPPPPPLRLPSPPPAVSKKRDAVEAASPPRRARKRLKKESTRAKWDSDDEESSEEEIEDDQESAPIEGPPSSQPRGVIPATQDSQFVSTGVSATQKVNTTSEESENEDDNSQSVDMDIDETQSIRLMPQRAYSTVAGKRSSLACTATKPIPQIAALAIPRSRALSRASEEEDEEEPTQITDPSYTGSKSHSAQQPKVVTRILAKSSPAVPDSDEKRLTDPSSALSELPASPAQLHAALPMSELDEPALDSGTTEYDGIPETQPIVPSNPGASPAVIIQVAPPRNDEPIAGPSRLPLSKGNDASRTKRKMSIPSHLTDYVRDSDSDPEVMPKPKNPRNVPKEPDSEDGEEPMVAPASVQRPRKTNRVDADDSDSEPEVIRPPKNRRAVSVVVAGISKEVKKASKKGISARPLLVIKEQKKGRAKAVEVLKIETKSDLIENYVLALYRNGSTQCFYPSKVCGTTAEGLKVRTADGAHFGVHYSEVRRCLIKEGDIVEFWGEGACGERLPVTRVEDHATTENLEQNQVPSPEDIVVCQHKGKTPAYQRWAVAAICYPADTKAQIDRLNDRKLNEWEVAAYQRHSTSRRRTVPTRALPASLTDRVSPALSINVPDGLFAGLGILLTEPPGSSMPTSPKRKASGSSANIAPFPDRSSIIKKLEQGGAHIFDEVNHLFKEEDEGQGVFIQSSAIRNLEQIYLVAPQPCATPKYLAALALGVPCVSQRWITQCAEEGELVDWRPHLLSAAPHVGLGVQARVLGAESFSVADLERRRRDAALLPLEPVLCLAVSQTSAESFGCSLRPLLLAMGASVVVTTARAARDISSGDLSSYGLVVYEDGRSDATMLSDKRVMSVHQLKDLVYTGRM